MSATETSAVRPRRRLPWPLDLYQSAVGKKYVMAASESVLIAHVLHTLGNLKL
jgi:hypothetical protein